MQYPQGLTVREATRLLEKFGPNEIKDVAPISPLRILFRQISKNFIVYLLAGAAIASFAVGKTTTGYMISLIILIIVITGFLQEFKAEKAVKALKKLIMAMTIVVRDGHEQEIPSGEIVPGDIIVLRTGEKIPADAILLEQTELRVNEAVLTGESIDVKKEIAEKDNKGIENKHKIFMGTYISNGKCIAKVLETGMRTEFGKIAGLISETEKELPLQKKVNNIARYMVFVALGASLTVGLIMVSRSLPLGSEAVTDIIIVMIALAVSAFPEAFPVVLMSTLARGAYNMAKENAIVNRMSIIETLGETTVICSDKTGTITTGEMTVQKIILSQAQIEVSGVGFQSEGGFIFKKNQQKILAEKDLQLALRAAVICNDASLKRVGENQEYRIIGTPTEGSLLIAGAKAGIFQNDLPDKRLSEIPFNSERKMMSVTVEEEGKTIIYAKGAPEALYEQCDRYLDNGEVKPFNRQAQNTFKRLAARLTAKRYRVIAVAYSPTLMKIKNKKSRQECLVEDNKLILVGLFALEDPPRENVAKALEQCRQAGIKVKMITGDNPETAKAIGQEIGLIGEIMTGAEIDKLTDAALIKAVKKIAIFARVRPEHKLRIVKALKKNKEIVTMTGDGVNDAPALKEAHIGVAMGKNGTDVSRAVADLVLKDDNFETIVSAIKTGRTIYSNIQKFITLQISLNYGEIMIIILAIALGLPLPLIALQILFMNMITDNLSAISLGFNPASKDAMDKPPRRNASLLNKSLIKLIFIAGTTIGGIALAVFYITLNITDDLNTARTTTMVALIFLEIANAFNFRSFRQPVHRASLFRNPYLVYASLFSITTTLILVNTPFGKVFELIPLSWPIWLTLAGIALIIIILFDTMKLTSHKKEGLALN